MARFAKKLGSQPMRYMFEVTLHRVTLHVPYDVSVSVVLKRGKFDSLKFSFRSTKTNLYFLVGPKRLES